MNCAEVYGKYNKRWDPRTTFATPTCHCTLTPALSQPPIHPPAWLACSQKLLPYWGAHFALDHSLVQGCLPVPHPQIPIVFELGNAVTLTFRLIQKICVIIYSLVIYIYIHIYPMFLLILIPFIHMNLYDLYQPCISFLNPPNPFFKIIFKAHGNCFPLFLSYFYATKEASSKYSVNFWCGVLSTETPQEHKLLNPGCSSHISGRFSPSSCLWSEIT